jgi:geranylgeranyl pyrophosphate synthase
MIAAGDEVASTLGVEQEIALLRERLDRWLEGADPELRDPLRWALAGRPKHFRPLTVFACRRAVGRPVTEETVELAFAVELLHNMTLVVDDVLDGSPDRRGVATLQRRFGTLPALMAAGYLVADAFAACAQNQFAVVHLVELLRRLGAAECLQWRLRRQPLGVADWQRIAGEDTGSMFELCAVLGAGSERLRRYGHLLGVLYHGCDDVGDLRGLEALGGGGEEDIRDGILTLPAALAIRDPAVRELFVREDGDEGRLARLAEAYRAQLDEAEARLERVADSARAEARQFAADPRPLLALADHTRRLSRQ